MILTIIELKMTIYGRNAYDDSRRETDDESDDGNVSVDVGAVHVSLDECMKKVSLEREGRYLRRERRANHGFF